MDTGPRIALALLFSVSAVLVAGASPAPLPGRQDLGRYRTSDPHPAASSVPRAITNRIAASGTSALPALVEHLVAGQDDPFVRLKAIHDWIALEISYDVQGFLGRSEKSADASSALRTRRAVCQGYSDLFARMAELAGFECVIVSGFGRGVGFSVFASEDLSRTNHAWNAVRVSDGWYLLDVTWDAGHLDGTTFRRAYSTAYFLIPPADLLYSHLPEDPEWQLIGNPIGTQDFAALPPLRGQYFAAGFAPPLGIGKINSCSGEAEIYLPGGTGATLQVQLIDEAGRPHENRAMGLAGEDGHRVLLAFPSAGRWMARLFVMDREVSGGEWIADLGFEAREGSDHRFPTLYLPYLRDRCRLVEPVWEPLTVGTTVRIRLELPGHSQAMAVGESERWTFDVAGDDVHEAAFVVPRCTEVRVFAKPKSGGEGYEGILSFPVSP